MASAYPSDGPPPLIMLDNSSNSQRHPQQQQQQLTRSSNFEAERPRAVGADQVVGLGSSKLCTSANYGSYPPPSQTFPTSMPTPMSTAWGTGSHLPSFQTLSQQTPQYLPRQGVGVIAPSPSTMLAVETPSPSIFQPSNHSMIQLPTFQPQFPSFFPPSGQVNMHPTQQHQPAFGLSIPAHSHQHQLGQVESWNPSFPAFSASTGPLLPASAAQSPLGLSSFVATPPSQPGLMFASSTRGMLDPFQHDDPSPHHVGAVRGPNVFAQSHTCGGVSAISSPYTEIPPWSRPQIMSLPLPSGHVFPQPTTTSLPLLSSSQGWPPSALPSMTSNTPFARIKGAKRRPEDSEPLDSIAPLSTPAIPSTSTQSMTTTARSTPMPTAFEASKPRSNMTPLKSASSRIMQEQVVPSDSLHNPGSTKWKSSAFSFSPTLPSSTLSASKPAATTVSSADKDACSSSSTSTTVSNDSGGQKTFNGNPMTVAASRQPHITPSTSRSCAVSVIIDSEPASRSSRFAADDDQNPRRKTIMATGRIQSPTDQDLSSPDDALTTSVQEFLAAKPPSTATSHSFFMSSQLATPSLPTHDRLQSSFPQYPRIIVLCDVCTDCNLQSQNRETIRHYSQVDGLQVTSDHACDMCGGSMQHDRRPARRGIFWCFRCQRDIERPDRFLAHSHLHTGKKAYCCEFCGVLFCRKHRWSAHRRDHHGCPMASEERRLRDAIMVGMAGAVDDVDDQ